MGKGGYGKSGGKRGYDWRQHCRPTDDPQLQNAIRERIERFVHDHSRTSEAVQDVWKQERVTYKQYCRMYGLAFVKVGRGTFRMEKVDAESNPFAELRDILEECTGGDKMETRVLLQHVKLSEPDLWKRLTVKGITNCSERKLMLCEEEVKKFFDVSPAWWYLAPKGKMVKEYAKPILLNTWSHGQACRRASQAARTAVDVLRRDGIGRKATAMDMFCVFAPTGRADEKSIAARVLAHRDHDRMLPCRQRLPTFKRREELLAAYDDNDVLVVCGATGCGKTTQLPQFLMEALAEKGGGRVLCTQPRRISATSVAERVAQERGEDVGEGVGYQIRFEHRAGPNTALLYCTVGILLRHLASNATLKGVSLVIVDEVHERDINTDFALLILRDLLCGPRPDLKVVLMSATIDASGFIDYFQIGTSQGSRLRVGYAEIPGKTNYPIEEFWAEDILRDVLPRYTPAGPPPQKSIGGETEIIRNAWASEPGAVARRLPGESEHVCQGIANMLRRPLNKLDIKMIAEVVMFIVASGEEGAILIFVPGWQEIADTVKELEKRASSVGETWRIFPLHSMVPPCEQRLIFEVPRPGVRKIIVSTNIAETSITVEDVVFVIDTGLSKGTTYTPETNIAALECQLVSRSNVQQRRGRAGRCRPGKFFKLYSKLEWDGNMSDSLLPEMQRTPVEELCLQVRALQLPGGIAESLAKALAPPSALAVSNAICLLRALGALDEDEELTTLGWKLSAMPLHPTLGKTLLLGSLLDCVPELLSVCATLSAKSPFVLPFGKEREADDAKQRLGRGLASDHLLYAKVAAVSSEMGFRQRNDWCQQNFLSDKTLQMIESMRKDLWRYLQELKLGGSARGSHGRGGEEEDIDDDCKKAELLATLCASLPLAVRPPSERKFKCLEAKSAKCSVHPSSLMKELSSAKKKKDREGDGHEFPVLCWFSRMKTADLYLHDVSVVADVLPLLLLSPLVTRRPSPQNSVFEVSWATSALETGSSSGSDDDCNQDETPASRENNGKRVASAVHEERASAGTSRGRWGNTPAAGSTALPAGIARGRQKDAWDDSGSDDSDDFTADARDIGSAQRGENGVREVSSSEDEQILSCPPSPPRVPPPVLPDVTQTDTHSVPPTEPRADVPTVPTAVSSQMAREVHPNVVPKGARKTERPRQRSQLLLHVADAGLADLLWELRGHLQSLVDLIVGEPPVRLPREVAVAFSALRQLLVTSYRIHCDDPSACRIVSSGGAGVVHDSDSHSRSGAAGLAGTRREKNDLFGLDPGHDSDSDPAPPPSKGKGKGGRNCKGKGGWKSKRGGYK